ncbi:hypothetical protein A1O3_01036 [Capronia epimyces CBS 606.96]|uniref:Oxidoreductase n=1 Tax=Capronia epimyces CBS 606.96 TaxID=1182542 RepID=W9ZD90_9EURO|nr:uncharacterized protein A1O3_01036 [Capronia epimyces CBS 606.96]EXJ92484.1 hypothetical protein A1O3_01036 [Capronia epimyces CBS 606.96]
MSPKLKWSPSSLPSLDGRTYVVTGGNTGIGYWTVHHLALHGATVYMTSRSAEKGQTAISSLSSSIQAANPEIKPVIHLVVMDLMSLQSVIQGARMIRSQCSQLHGMVNSAGIMATPFLLSDDGYESQFQTNYLAHWLLTWHLLPLLESTASASAPLSPAGSVRVVNVSSTGHSAAPKGGIDFADPSLRNAFTFRRYGQSKLANILHATALQARYTPTTAIASERTPTTSPTTTTTTIASERNPSPSAAAQSQSPTPQIYALSLHPGNVDTQLNTKSWGASITPVLRCLGVYITPEQGSFNSLWAVASPSVTAEMEMGAGYFIPVGRKTAPSKLAQDAVLATRLWAWTEEEMRHKGLLEPL